MESNCEKMETSSIEMESSTCMPSEGSGFAEKSEKMDVENVMKIKEKVASIPKKNTKLQYLFENFGLEFLPNDLSNEDGEKKSLETDEGSEESEDNEIDTTKLTPSSSSSSSASSSTSASSKELFRIAFINYRLTMTDGIPQNIPGFDYLYIGSIGSAYNLENLRKYGITHILCLSEVIKLRFPDHFIYQRVAISDKPTFDLQPYLQACYEFIDEAKAFIHPETNQPGKVLVHCYQGISRSTAVCCAYLITSSKGLITRDEGLGRIKSIRQKACPNTGFMKILKKIEDDTMLQYHVSKPRSSDETDSAISEVTDTEVEEEN